MRQLKIVKQITNRDTQAVEIYLQEIGKKERITSDEEVRLAQKRDVNPPGSKGYQEAIDSLVHANLRFVVSVAKQYQNQGLSLPDLINEGNIGCIKAAQRFDATKGFKFISYAVWRIRQSISQALAEQGRMVRLPQNKVSTANKIGKAIQAFEQEHERFPTDDELAEILDMSPTDITNLLASKIKHSSLDADLPGFEGDGMTLGDLVQAESQKVFSVFTFDNDDERIEATKAFLKAAGLSHREEEITLAYFGFGGLTSEYVEKKYDLTKESVRQIKERAIKRLVKRKVAMSFLRDDIIINEKKKKDTSDWINASKPLGKPLQEGDLKPIDSPIVSPTPTKIEVEKKKPKKTEKKPEVVGELTPSNISEAQENTKKELVENLVIEALNEPGVIVETEQVKDSQISTNNKVIEDLETTSQRLTSLKNSILSYVNHGNIDGENTIIRNILQQLELKQNTLKIYQKMYVDGNHVVSDNRIKDKIEAIGIQIKNIDNIIQTSKKVDRDNIKAENQEIMTIDSELIGDKKVVYSNEQLNKILITKYDWERNLENQNYNINKKQCINTFMHYYIDTITSPIGKTYSQEIILREAKLRTGILIGQDMFNTYITEFLECIGDL